MLLIVKKRTIPIEIPKHKALLGRIHSNHPRIPEIEKNYKNKMAGYNGEKSLDFYLSLLSDSKYYIFHGLRLLYKNYYFQIDTLILCAQFALILEVKNIAGKLYFDKDFHQMTRTRNDMKERYKNPVAQARLQAFKLKKWLQKHHYVDLPIQYLFVNSNERAILISNSKSMNRNICNSEFLNDKIEQIENYYNIDKLDAKDLRKIKRLLLTSHIPANPDILQTYKISPKEILTGVRCPYCDYLAMKYKRGKWECPNCKEKSNSAHIQAIQDYFLLIKPSITNSELRCFLHIESPKIAHKILTSMDLPYTGKFKDRVYYQPLS
jgi:hypothetical protein